MTFAVLNNLPSLLHSSCCWRQCLMAAAAYVWHSVLESARISPSREYTDDRHFTL